MAIEEINLKQLTLAVRTIAEEKNLPEETVLDVIEQAIASAWRRDNGERDQEVRAELNINDGSATVFVRREVVEEANRGAAQDILQEISQEVESEVVVEVDTKTLSTEDNESDNVEVLTPILDESLKDFYLNVKQLISQFNLVQNQLKQIENKFSGT